MSRQLSLDINCIDELIEERGFSIWDRMGNFKCPTASGPVREGGIGCWEITGQRTERSYLGNVHHRVTAEGPGRGQIIEAQ